MRINKNIIFWLCFLFAGILPAQSDNAPDPSFDSPYNTIFVHLHYLQVDSYQPEIAGRSMQGISDPELAAKRAIQLKQVLDGKGLFVHLNLLPQENNYLDSMSRKAYYTPFPEALPELYLEKVDSLWLYSKETVELIPALHKNVYPLGMDRVLNWLPKTGQQTFFGLAIWQYWGILFLIVLTWLVYRLLSLVLYPLVKRLMRSRFSDELVDGKVRSGIARYLSIILLLNIVRMVLPVLQLPVKLAEFTVVGIRIALTILVVLLSLRIVKLIMNYASRYASGTEQRMDEQIIPIVRRMLTIVIVLGGCIQVLRLLDVNVTALIAGVSIGGLALALAAQDTVKNLIGSAMIFIDKPFQIGDYIEIGGMAGTVTEVGFRSTRIRTSDTSIIAVPNGSVANQAVTNKGVRTFRLFQTNLGLTYNTPPEKIEEFIKQLRQIILDHPFTHKENFYVHFNQMSASSLDVLFRSYLSVPSYDVELQAKEEIYLSILRLAASLEIDFAFPSSSIYVEQLPAK